MNRIVERYLPVQVADPAKPTEIPPRRSSRITCKKYVVSLSRFLQSPQSSNGQMICHSHRSGTCDPFQLFETVIHSEIAIDIQGISRNMELEAGNSPTLMIWAQLGGLLVDENIGAEIAETCQKPIDRPPPNSCALNFFKKYYFSLG